MSDLLAKLKENILMQRALSLGAAHAYKEELERDTWVRLRKAGVNVGHRFFFDGRQYELAELHFWAHDGGAGITVHAHEILKSGKVSKRLGCFTEGGQIVDSLLRGAKP